MRKIKLPKERRITGDMTRPVLRTSFVSSNDKKVTIAYSEIRGSVVVNGNPIIEAESLRRVGENFRTDTSNEVHTPNLHTVGGNLDVTSSSMLVATSLRDVGGSVYLLGRIPPNLVTIGGRCVIQSPVVGISENSLRYVRKSLTINDVAKIHFPKLECVGEHLVLLESTRIDARMLREVGGTLLAGQAKVMLMPKLRFVGGDLNSQSAKEFFHPELLVRGHWMLCEGACEIWIRRMHALTAMKGNQGPLYL